jgi:hypothetical protein
MGGEEMIVFNISSMQRADFQIMKSRCAFVSFVLFCAVSLLALPAFTVTLPYETFVLAKPTLKTGDVRRLLLTVTTLDVRKGDEKHKKVVKFTEKYSRTVKAVKSDGSAILVLQMEARQIVKDEKKVLPRSQPLLMTITRSPEGRMTAVANGGTVEGDANIGTEFQEPLDLAESLYPQKAVAVGDHWPITYSMGMSKGLGQAELTGTKQLAGVKALNIKFTAEGNVENTLVKSHIEGVFTVNTTTNEILKYETTESTSTREQTLTCRIVLLVLSKNPKEDPK